MSIDSMLGLIIAGLNGAPDNRDARLALHDLEQAGVFRPEPDSDRLGELTFDGKNYSVERKAGEWRGVKLWQISIVPQGPT